jgi:glutaryl-CoA dehydrogenase
MSDYSINNPLDTDYFGVFDSVPAEDRVFWDRARQFSTESSEELIQAWDKADYPLHLVKRLGELDLLTDAVEGPGLTKMSPLAAGLINMEISRGDGSMGTVIAVQGGLALRSIALYGSDAQKEKWLVPLARAEKLGAFALTEPMHGSDSVGLETSANKVDGGWRLNGEKMWIGNGSVGDVSVVWARDDEGDVRGFLVDQAAEGYEAETVTGKGSLRAIHQARIQLRDVFVPDEDLLPGAKTFKDTAIVLHATRIGVAWSALGHATALFESALSYTQERIQFGKPLAKFQIVQERLSHVLSLLTSMQLYCVRLAELDAQHKLTPTQASLGKMYSTRTARKIASIVRDMLGGNGILLEYKAFQHMADIEAIHTYEGTETIQSLLVARDLTGLGAFS